MAMGYGVRLEPQPAKALTRLVEHSGDLVSRGEMRDLVCFPLACPPFGSPPHG
jgi:hypothetical protein